MKVYLAGPITGHSFSEAAGWRESVREAFPEVDWLDPLRGKDHLRNNDRPLPSNFDGDMDAVARDLNDVRVCDALLVNLLGATHASIGTMCELGYAYAQQRPIYVAAEVGGVYDHLFVRSLATEFCPTLEAAVEALLS